MEKGSRGKEKRAPEGARQNHLFRRFCQSLGILRDHQFLVGRDHVDLHAGLVGREFGHARSSEGLIVDLTVKIDAEEIKSGQSALADRSGVLADPGGEDDASRSLRT